MNQINGNLRIERVSSHTNTKLMNELGEERIQMQEEEEEEDDGSPMDDSYNNSILGTFLAFFNVRAESSFTQFSQDIKEIEEFEKKDQKQQKIKKIPLHKESMELVSFCNAGFQKKLSKT